MDGSASQVRPREVHREVDDFGNETHVAAATVGGASCTTTRLFDNLTDPWQIGLLRDSATSCAEAGQPPSETQEARETHYDYDVKGRLKKVVAEPNRPDLTSTVHYQRDGVGHVIKTTYTTPGEIPRHLYAAYDDEGIYPRAEWNDLGHTRRQIIHPALGVQILAEDIDGVQARSTYDGFGRIRGMKPDGGIGVEVSYAADDPAEPTGIVITRTAEDGGETITRFDSDGRAVESQSIGFDGQWLHETAQFNLFGQQTKASRPGVGQPSAYGTTTTYDTLGRTVRVEGPDGAATSYQHSMFGVTVTDPKGRVRKITRDLDDRVTESADWKDDHWIATTYRYAAWGLLHQVIDAAGNRTDIHHDALGRRVQLDDPDRGTSRWELNGWGEVLSATDGLGDMTVYERDRLGRVVWQHHDQEGVTTFDYDGAPYAPGAQGAAGALTRAISPEGVATQFYYDQLGRPSRTSWRLDEEELSVDREYDALGRLETLRYPETPGRDRFSAWYRYNTQGYLDKVSDVSDGIAALPLYTVTGRNAEDMLTGAAMGNGVVEARDYHPVTGRIAAIEALGGAGPLYSIGYHHDLSGDLESRADHVTGRDERFQYDALDRLWKWKVTHKGAARELTYGHDDLGNLESVTSPEGTELFHHDGQAVQSVLRLPHALTSRSSIGGGAGMGGTSGSYWYDDKGRQVSGGGREIEWRSFDQPAAIYQGGTTTKFAYDAFGRRVSKVHEGASGVETTLTLGDLYERRTGADGHVAHLFTVHGPDAIVAQVVYRPDAPPAQRDEVLYLQGDVQGSVGLVIDKDGHEVERRMFDPFGLVTDASGVPVSGGGAGGSGGAGAQLGEVKLGFTGHRHDGELGLIHARGRMYDPGQKRFLTADPTVPDPLFGQSLNRYQYCFGNPVRFTDPTGFDPVPGPSINGMPASGLGGTIIVPRLLPPGGAGGGLGAMNLTGGAPGAVPVNAAHPSSPSSTSETGNKPASGPAADAPKAQTAAPSKDYTNPLMQDQVLDPHVVHMMAGQRWYSKVYDPPLYPETGAVRDFVVRHGNDVADGVSLGGSILWGGATLGTGWFAGEAITAGGRLTIDGAMDGDPESIVKGAIKLAEGVMEAADIDVSGAIAEALDDTPAPSGDVTGGGGPDAGQGAPGTIYLRRNVATGEEYVGQAKPGRLLARQAEHAANHPGEQFEYDVLEEVQPGSGRNIDVAEEDWIRAGGGPKRFGGRLANDRYQMSEKSYRAAGGTVPKPTR